jgi:hypothetical protein
VTKSRLRCAAALLALAVAGCGDGTAGDKGRAAATAPPSTTVLVTSSPTTVLAPSSIAPSSTTRRAPSPTSASPTTANTAPSPSPIALGPEWTQQGGRVLIEAVASGDPQALLRDLVALGLSDGVVVGRVVNGWLPVSSFERAQRLGSLQFVRPTGAGTG